MNDRDNKTGASGPTHLLGYITSYDVNRRIYIVRPSGQNRVPIKCPAVDNGFDIPYAQGDRVALHFYPDYGYVIAGRLPGAESQVPLAITQPDDTTPRADTKISYRTPLDKDDRFYARAGDIAVNRGGIRFFFSSVGSILYQVAADCSRYMTASLATIIDTCWTYIRSQPGITLVSKVETDSTKPTVGQPSVALEVVPTDKDNNTMQLQIGGGIIDSTTDGIDLVLGQLVRLMLKLTPANPTLEYTHGESRTKIQIDLQQFLLQFGQAQFSWSDSGLSITQGSAAIRLDAADLLEIVSAGLTILMTGSIDVTATGLKVNAPAEFITPVKIQGFDALTVYTTLNALILAFNAHNHLLGPLPTTPPTAAGAVTPIVPTA